MTRIATFTPVITLDLDTKVVSIDFGGSLQSVSTDEYADEAIASEMLDSILQEFPHSEPHQQGQVLRNLAAHIDQFTIEEMDLG